MRRGGTETARPLDVGRVAKALRSPGIDPRHWLSYGTVCTINENGSANFGDGSAVAVNPGGVTVDVLLMPANQHVPCRYPGVQGGATGTIYTPIKPGDEVVVGIPDGDLRLPPVILAVMSGEHSPMPLEEDRTPVFKNDRILVDGAGVPVEVRTSGDVPVRVHTTGDAPVEIHTSAVKVKVNPDGTIQLGENASEQVMMGTTYRNSEGTMNQTMITSITTMSAAATAMTPGDIAAITAIAATVGAFLTAFKVFTPLWLAAVQQFESQASTYLSNVSKTE